MAARDCGPWAPIGHEDSVELRGSSTGKVVVPVLAGKARIPWLRSGGVLVLISPCRSVVTGMNELVAPRKVRAVIDQMLAIG